MYLAAIIAGALAFVGLRALGLDDGRAAGAVIIFLVALLPCSLLLGALADACNWRVPLAAVVAAGALLAGLVTTGVLLVRGGGDDTPDYYDRQGPHRNL